MSDSLLTTLGKFAYNLEYEDLPNQVVERCKTFILHGIGVGLCGFNTEIGQMGIEVAKKMGQGGDGKATILVDGSRVTAPAAAFANATMFHSLAEEDTYAEGLLHPGVCAIPPALSIGEVNHATGREVITAVAAGYEIGARTSDDIAKRVVGRGFRSSATFGPMISATVAGKLLRLPRSELVIAMGWGVNLAFGLIEWALAKTNEMPLQNGFVASNGITAAFLGQSKATVADTILEGDKGFYKSFAGTQENLDKITDGLGEIYKMAVTEIKRNPAGGHAQTPSLAMLNLLKERDIDASEIERIKVRLNPKDTTYPGYKSMKPGVINVRYLLSIACLKKELTAESENLDESPQVLDLMSRVDVIDDESVPSVTCRLEVILKNGKVLSQNLDMSGGRWCFSLEEEIKWQREVLFTQMPLELEKANDMVGTIENLEHCQDMSDLMKILVSPARKSPRYRIVF